MNMCPGWSQTDMAGYNAPQTAAEGADTVIWLETMNPQLQMQATGRFFKSRTEIPWWKENKRLRKAFYSINDYHILV